MRDHSRGSNGLALLLSVTLVLVALAGCVGSGGPSDAAPTVDDGTGDDGDDGDATDGNGTGANATETPAVPSSISFGACKTHLGAFEIPAELAADEMPPGFAPASAYHPVGGTATVIAAGNACGNATSDAFDGPVDDLRGLDLFLQVDPPDEYEDEDLLNYLIHIGSVTTSPKVMQVQQAWNLTSVEEGSVELTETITPGARTGQVEARSDNLSATLHTAVPSEAAGQDNDGFTSRLLVVPDEEVTDVVDINASAFTRITGAGEMVLEPFGTGPVDRAFWAVINAATTGYASHWVADGFGFELWRRAPAEVAGS